MSVNIKEACQKKCFIAEEDICYGCFRTLKDIIAWKTATEEEKYQILHSAKVLKSSTEPKKYWYAFEI
jgi:predicted Fe-S protein YdhL (DUF1289 family)